MKRRRLDTILLERNLAPSAHDAFLIVTEGRVLVRGQKAISPAQFVDPNAAIEIRSEEKYVGRGAEKLEAAIEKFKARVSGNICADIGAATGGFTEVLLRRGAAKVYAIDTARGKMAPKIRNDPRVVVMERVDVRDGASLPESIALAVADVSLISLRGILPHIRRLLNQTGEAIVLFKPQYETRDQTILRHGVIRDQAAAEKLLQQFLQWLSSHGWRVKDQMESPIRGSKGNKEYLLYIC